MVPRGRRAQHHQGEAARVTRPGMTTDELFALLERCGGFYDSLGDDGDPLPVLDHGLQCAALLDRGPG